MKTAVYDKSLHQLTYWDSKNTQQTIDCRNYKCAELVILSMKMMHKVNQQLIKQ